MLDSIHLHSSGAQELSFNDFLKRLAPWMASGKFSATEMTYIDSKLAGMYESDRLRAYRKFVYTHSHPFIRRALIILQVGTNWAAALFAAIFQVDLVAREN